MAKTNLSWRFKTAYQDGVSYVICGSPPEQREWTGSTVEATMATSNNVIISVRSKCHYNTTDTTANNVHSLPAPGCSVCWTLRTGRRARWWRAYFEDRCEKLWSTHSSGHAENGWTGAIPVWQQQRQPRMLHVLLWVTLTLLRKHPKLICKFPSGTFCCAQVSATTIHQTNEQVNATVKGGRDAVGVNEDSSSVNRQVVAGAEVRRLVNLHDAASDEKYAPRQ